MKNKITTQKTSEHEQMYKELLLWKAPDFGLDDIWARTYPYEQTVMAGECAYVEVQFTNHAETE